MEYSLQSLYIIIRQGGPRQLYLPSISYSLVKRVHKHYPHYFTTITPWMKGRDKKEEKEQLARAAVVHLNFRAESTFPVPVCTVSTGHCLKKQTLNRTSRCNKVDADRLQVEFTFIKGSEVRERSQMLESDENKTKKKVIDRQIDKKWDEEN